MPVTSELVALPPSIAPASMPQLRKHRECLWIAPTSHLLHACHTAQNHACRTAARLPCLCCRQTRCTDVGETQPTWWLPLALPCWLVWCPGCLLHRSRKTGHWIGDMKNQAAIQTTTLMNRQTMETPKTQSAMKIHSGDKAVADHRKSHNKHTVSQSTQWTYANA